MRRRLSYANVTATLALVFAMSGGAMAANHYLITSTKQISPKVLKKLTGKPGANGTNGATGATGPTGSLGAAGAKGEKGETGLKGEKGEPGSALAYAHINPNGTLDVAHSKNVAASNLSSPSAGFYCFKNLPFTVSNVQATLDYNGTANGEILQIDAQVPGTAGACGTEAQAMVFVGKNVSASFTEGVSTGLYVNFN